MRLSEYSKGLRASEITPLLQFFLAGILAGEAWAIGRTIGVLLNKHIATLNMEISFLSFAGFSAITCLIYAGSRGACLESRKLVRSLRFDLLFVVILGFYLSFNSDGFGNEFYAKNLEKLKFSQLVCILASPVIIAWFAMIKASIYTIKKEDVHPFFMSDREVEDTHDDLLDIRERSNIFAERVLNGGSSESLVFGIDAPWGAGKSTFVNFCRKHWENQSGKKPIIHQFEPLRYQEGVDLTEKFIDDLINTIQEHVFAPSLRPLFKRYENLVKDKKHSSYLDIKRALSLNNDTVESTLEEIDYTLKSINTRIIVIVDDLDRLHWSSIKSILFSIKRSFKLSNVSYVLCYDTTNINITNEHPDSEKTLEFLEKFVNIKTSLFLGAHELSSYVFRYFDQSAKKSFSLSDDATKQLKAVSHELIALYEGKDFHLYTPYIGDIRKIKRIINTLMLLDIDKNDFNETDFNKRDLLHLILIYIYYPSIFRKIYESETSGKSNTFSLIQEGELKTSKFYDEYKKELPHINQQFLLSRVFEPLQRSANYYTEADLASRAFFQDKRRPLEKYLYLIAKLSKPISWESLRSYENKTEKLLTAPDIKLYLDDVSKKAPLNKETGQEEFWRVATKNINSFKVEKSTLIIDYLIETLPTHSLLKSSELSEFRSNAIRLITKFLDETITSSAKKDDSKLPPAERAIVNLVYGDKEKPNTGIIEKMVTEKRGALGFHDLITFRYYCTIKTKHERLWRALTLHANEDPSFSTSHEATKNQARELSQSIFQAFKQRYILNEKNIFAEIDSIDERQLFGRYTELYNEDTENWKIKVKSKKQDIKQAITSQLGNKIIGESGIYNEDGGGDNDGISNEFSNYLFSVCFNPESPNGYIHFGEYLLTYTDSSSRDPEDTEYKSSLNSIKNNINMDQLEKYWITHHKNIKTELLKFPDNMVYKSYSSPTFRYDLPPVYRALDSKFLLESNTDGESPEMK